MFVDDREIEDFAGITATITTSLAASKTLVAYYSAAYPTRRSCQWELTAAYLAARERLLGPEDPDHPTTRTVMGNLAWVERTLAASAP